jgi:uncharacterized protein DUF3551
MRTLFLILPALSVLALFTPAASHADPYKWCAQSSDGSGGRNCGFVTFQQCQEDISGIGGFCERNQFYTGPQQSAPHRHYRG